MKTLQRCCVDCPAALLCLVHKVDSIIRDELGACRCWRLFGMELPRAMPIFEDSQPPPACPLLEEVDANNCAICINLEKLKPQWKEIVDGEETSPGAAVKQRSEEKP